MNKLFVPAGAYATGITTAHDDSAEPLVVDWWLRLIDTNSQPRFPKQRGMLIRPKGAINANKKTPATLKVCTTSVRS
jgi:hypothetical protein